MYTIPNHQSCDMKICCIKQKYAWPLDITDNDGDTHKKGNYYDYFQEFYRLDEIMCPLGYC